MLTPSKAIELLTAAGVHKVDLNNEQPHRPKLDLGMTVEAQAAELITHYQRREQDLLEANSRYIMRARTAEERPQSVVVDGASSADIQSDQWVVATRGPRMSDAAGRVIFKYQMPVLEQFTLKLPRGAEIIRVADDDGKFWLWAVVDTYAPDEERKFRAFKTGGKMPAEIRLRYVGFCAVFVQMELGLYIFEEIANA